MKNAIIRNKSVLEMMIIIIIAIVAVLLFSQFVPLNMDEFCVYHPLAVRNYPLNKLNVFHERPTQYDLAPLPGLYLPLRAYHYLGSVTCLIYYPLFRVWPSPYSARFLGLIMLALQAFLIYKLLRTDPLVSFLILLFFMPYSFQHIADTGPVSLHTTSIFMLYYLLRGWCTSIKNKARSAFKYPVIIGLILFLGIWVKLTYVVLLPAIMLMIFYSFFESGIQLKRNVKTLGFQIAVLCGTFIVPTFILLNSTDRAAHKYFYQFTQTGALMPETETLFLNNHFLKILSYFTNPLLSAHRIFTIDNPVSLQGIFLIILIIAFIGIGIRYMRRSAISLRFTIFNIILFSLTLLIVLLLPKTWAMHHVVLSFPFLIIAVFHIGTIFYKKMFVFVCTLLFLFINVSIYHDVTHLKHIPSDHPSKTEIMRLIDSQYANDYAFIIIDWGFYYLKALYGNKNQCVIYITPFNKIEQGDLLKKILTTARRRPMFIGRVDSESDLSLIKEAFPGLSLLDTDFDTGKWRIWY